MSPTLTTVHSSRSDLDQVFPSTPEQTYTQPQASPAPSTTTLPSQQKAHEPPPLPYTLRTRKLSIALTWTILLFTTSLQVNLFYFTLRYATTTADFDSRVDTAVTVPTALLLGLSILSIGHRTYLLVRKNSNVRPVGGVWWSLDFFHIQALMGFVIVTVVLTLATEDEPKNIRQASLPQTIILFQACSQLIATGVMSRLGMSAPFSLSSTKRGELVRPGVFILIEDIVAVDGAGGLAYREALVRRYEASPVFRSLVARMNWFWGIGGLIVAGVMTGLIYGVEDENVAFALGWSVPWACAGVWAVLTVWYAKRMLEIEEQTFRGPWIQRVRELSMAVEL